MIPAKLFRALPIAWVVNALIIYLVLFNQEPFAWMNLLTAFFYSMMFSLVFWGTYRLVTKVWPRKN